MSTTSDDRLVRSTPALSYPSFSVAGRYFLITGGTQGLGLTIAELLLELGAAGTVIVGRDPSKGQIALEKLQAKSSSSIVEFLAADVGNVQQVRTVVEQATEKLREQHKRRTKSGQNEDSKTVILTGLVNAAATTTRGNLHTETIEGFDRHFAVNTRAPFVLTQAFANALESHNNNQNSSLPPLRGSVVNIASCASYGGAPFVMAYSASKAALVCLTKNNAHELVQSGIRVNAVNMGWCYTDNEDTLQTAQTDSQWIERADASVPLGRILRPRDVAVTVAFLLSENSSPMMNGTVVELHPEYARDMISLATVDQR
jgi:NAD(P)-dependent dehydrogenase (short-subunit alcohol dehydrogenase family)